MGLNPSFFSRIMKTPRASFPISRRHFLRGAATLAGGAALAGTPAARGAVETGEDLRRIMDAPVLNLDAVKSPVTVASLELLRNGRNYLVRARSTDGLEVVTVPNPAIMAKA